MDYQHAQRLNNINNNICIRKRNILQDDDNNFSIVSKDILNFSSLKDLQRYFGGSLDKTMLSIDNQNDLAMENIDSDDSDLELCKSNLFISSKLSDTDSDLDLQVHNNSDVSDTENHDIEQNIIVSHAYNQNNTRHIQLNVNDVQKVPNAGDDWDIFCVHAMV